MTLSSAAGESAVVLSRFVEIFTHADGSRGGVGFPPSCV